MKEVVVPQTQIVHMPFVISTPEMMSRMFAPDDFTHAVSDAPPHTDLRAIHGILNEFFNRLQRHSDGEGDLYPHEPSACSGDIFLYCWYDHDLEEERCYSFLCTPAGWYPLTDAEEIIWGQKAPYERMQMAMAFQTPF